MEKLFTLGLEVEIFYSLLKISFDIRDRGDFSDLIGKIASQRICHSSDFPQQT